MRKLLKEFQAFAFGGSLIDLAIGLAIGMAFAAVLDAFVMDLILPIVAAIFGQPSFDALHVQIGQGDILYGSFLSVFVQFVLIAFVILLIVKAIKRVTGKEAVGAQGNRECPHCRSFIPVDASVCMFCTRDVEPVVKDPEPATA